MSMARELRCAFIPDALSVLDDAKAACEELLADGVLSNRRLRTDQVRADLARKLIRIASAGWNAIRMKQILVRAFRNRRSTANCQTAPR